MQNKLSHTYCQEKLLTGQFVVTCWLTQLNIHYSLRKHLISHSNWRDHQLKAPIKNTMTKDLVSQTMNHPIKEWIKLETFWCTVVQQVYSWRCYQWWKPSAHQNRVRRKDKDTRNASYYKVVDTLYANCRYSLKVCQIRMNWELEASPLNCSWHATRHYFAASGHNLYAKSVYLNLQSMLNLETSHQRCITCS